MVTNKKDTSYELSKYPPEIVTLYSMFVNRVSGGLYEQAKMVLSELCKALEDLEKSADNTLNNEYITRINCLWHSLKKNDMPEVKTALDSLLFNESGLNYLNSYAVIKTLNFFGYGLDKKINVYTTIPNQNNKGGYNLWTRFKRWTGNIFTSKAILTPEEWERMYHEIFKCVNSEANQNGIIDFFAEFVTGLMLEDARHSCSDNSIYFSRVDYRLVLLSMLSRLKNETKRNGYDYAK